MVLQDVMLGYNKALNVYYVYAEGRQVEIKGDMDRYRAIALFEKAVEVIKGNR